MPAEVKHDGKPDHGNPVPEGREREAVSGVRSGRVEVVISGNIDHFGFGKPTGYVNTATDL